jgi:hypothetical protein
VPKAISLKSKVKERVPRDTARQLSVYRSIPRETRGKDEGRRLYLKRRMQELLRVQDIGLLLFDPRAMCSNKGITGCQLEENRSSTLRDRF